MVHVSGQVDPIYVEVSQDSTSLCHEQMRPQIKARAMYDMRRKYIRKYIFIIIMYFSNNFWFSYRSVTWRLAFLRVFFFVPTSSPCRPFEVTVLFERDYIDLSIFSLSLDPAVTACGRLRFLTKISAVVPAIIFYRCSYDYDGKSQRYHTDLALIFINPDWNFIARNSSSWKDCECSFPDSIS